MAPNVGLEHVKIYNEPGYDQNTIPNAFSSPSKAELNPTLEIDDYRTSRSILRLINANFPICIPKEDCLLYFPADVMTQSKFFGDFRCQNVFEIELTYSSVKRGCTEFIVTLPLFLKIEDEFRETESAKVKRAPQICPIKTLGFEDLAVILPFTDHTWGAARLPPNTIVVLFWETPGS